jgi:DNA-binding transcriptional ArsR family regulator
LTFLADEHLLKKMVNQSTQLDRVFQALADGTRRSLVERLLVGPASVTELAKPFNMSLPAVMQHLQVLEDCNLIRSEKSGRVRTCQLESSGLRTAESWIAQQRTTWEDRLDRLDDLLSEQAT